mmetsp:Transcript_45320/g.124824  ORF Transcript_45320/g.124824 Transcript_45320/m.124824 type:complete len:202 (+) Transcript_45320:456-1061(+)
MVLPYSDNVIYTWDYFEPDKYVGGSSSLVYDYPQANVECKNLYDDCGPSTSAALDTAMCCPEGNSALMDFDKNKLRADFESWAIALRDAAKVPIFMNQWSVVHGVTADNGRFDYIEDVASLAAELGFGWAWFPWRGSGDEWSFGSQELAILFSNGTMGYDQAAIAAMAPYMGQGSSNHERGASRSRRNQGPAAESSYRAEA